MKILFTNNMTLLSFCWQMILNESKMDGEGDSVHVTYRNLAWSAMYTEISFSYLWCLAITKKGLPQGEQQFY